MRWTRAWRQTNATGCGRRSRVVLMPRRRHQALWKYLQGDGDKKARSPGRSRRKPLKPIARGMPDYLWRTCGDYTRMLILFCMRGCGRYPSARHSLREWFYGCFVLSPVIGLSCHRPRRDAKHHRQVDFSVEKSGPHDFAVRFPVHSSRALQASIASRAQRP